MLVLLALVFVPLAEIALFVVLGGEIGLTATLVIVLVTAIIGSVTLRTQGLNTLEKLRALKADEEAPIVLIEGLMILVSGLLLLTPGFLTDTIGFLLLVPPIRNFLAQRAAARAIIHIAGGRPANNSAGFRQGAPGPRARDDTPFEKPETQAKEPSPSKRSDVEDAQIIDDEPPQQ